jgi:hypothetical protein
MRGFLMVRQNIAGFIKLRLSERPSHKGLAGLVQFFGVLVFVGMAGSRRKNIKL